MLRININDPDDDVRLAVGKQWSQDEPATDSQIENEVQLVWNSYTRDLLSSE